MYSSQVLDHFEHPRNAGVLEPADAAVQVENPVCGDVLKLTARMAKGKIAEVKFLAKGCVPAIACGSALTEVMIDKRINEAALLSREELELRLGGLPQASTHAASLAIDAVAALLSHLRRTEASVHK